MSKCEKCSKRKAKRYCAALGESLCQLCCGLLREKEIHCPSNCSFLKIHTDYQDKRKIERKQNPFQYRLASEKDILDDDRMAWLSIQVESPLKEYTKYNESLTDQDVLLALEYAKNKIDKKNKFFFTFEDPIEPLNEIGEAIYKGMEECRFEKKIIIPGENLSYTKTEKLNCLDRMILMGKYFSYEKPKGKNYINHIHGI